MSPHKILFVDDEPMAVKYFERLVSPLAPVVTAMSVEQGKAVLQAQGDEIAVLVSDQRMPGAHGNELLGYAREFHPGIVRMLTTAYSEIGEAIEAINSGEIYRYITKPWDLGSLHADLRNALELANLRGERDHLVREKLLVQQQQLMGSRFASLSVMTAGAGPNDAGAAALQRYASTALACGCSAPAAAWHQWDVASLLQAEARRSMAVARSLERLQADFGTDRSPDRALELLSQSLGGLIQGTSLQLPSAAPLTCLLDAAPGQLPEPADAAWLGWLLWWNAPVQVVPGPAAAGTAVTSCTVQLANAGTAESAPQADWLVRAIEQLVER